jgi:PAS domain S-box-containing protein
MGSFIWYPDGDLGIPDEQMLALFGLPADGVLNLATALASRIHPDDTERYALAVERAIDPAGGGELHEEIRVIHPNGDERWVAVSARVSFVGQPPRVDRMAGVAFDITARVQAAAEREALLAAEVEAREAAEEASRAREEFLSIASHELRNPVAALHGTAQLMRRAHAAGRLTDERLERYLEALEASARHLATLTDDLLDVSRLERGEMPLHLGSVDLSSVVRDIVRHGEWGDGRFVLEADQALEVMIDEQRIRQVLANLIDNAVKYSPGEETVRVRVAPSDHGVLLEVEDRGIGLPADSLEAIFTPFGRAPNAAAANIPGLGLGLYLARRIVEQHGGKLWARSEGEGCGTVMSLWLPYLEHAGEVAVGIADD